MDADVAGGANDAHDPAVADDPAAAMAGLTETQREHLVSHGDTTYDVDYADDTVVVSGAGLAALVEGDDASGTYTFDTAAAPLADVPHEPSGADVLVAAGSSSVPRLEQISLRMPDGQVVPVQSTQDVGEAIVDSIEVNEAEGSVDWTFSSDGNTYQFRLTAQGESVAILVVVSREVGGAVAMGFRGEGTIGSMRSVSSSTFADGELVDSDVGLEQLASDIDLSLAVAGAGTAPVDFTVPVPMLTFTWLVGPIPVTLDLTTEIIGRIETELDASAQADASFSYRGDAGFSFEGVGVSASGETDLAEMSPEPADSSASMGMNVDAQFGVAFPRVSMSMLGQGLVPYLRTGAVIGSRLAWGDPAAGFAASSICKSAYVRMEVSGGYDFTVLGRSLAEDEFELYNEENAAQNDRCPNP